MRSIDLMLNEIEERGAPELAQLQYLRIDLLRLIEHRLPPPALAGFALAVNRITDLKEVRTTIERLWKFLNSHFPGQDLKRPEVSSTRAVICVLSEIVQPDANFVDALVFLMTLINNVEPHIAEQTALLQQHLGSYLRE